MTVYLRSCIPCRSCHNLIMLNEYQENGGYCKACVAKAQRSSAILGRLSQPVPLLAVIIALMIIVIVSVFATSDVPFNRITEPLPVTALAMLIVAFIILLLLQYRARKNEGVKK